MAEQYGISIEARRNQHGLLDQRASAVAACAVAAGLAPEAATDYVALDLVAAG